jgi:hypothetical protein
MLGDKQKSISSIFAWGDNEDGQVSQDTYYWKMYAYQ